MITLTFQYPTAEESLAAMAHFTAGLRQPAALPAYQPDAARPESAKVERAAKKVAPTTPADPKPAASAPGTASSEATAAPDSGASAADVAKKSETPAVTPPASATAGSATTASAESAPALESPSEAFTLQDVRAKLAALSQGGKQEAVKSLISSFGQTALSAIPADKYPELMEKAAAL